MKTVHPVFISIVCCESTQKSAFILSREGTVFYSGKKVDICRNLGAFEALKLLCPSVQ